MSSGRCQRAFELRRSVVEACAWPPVRMRRPRWHCPAMVYDPCGGAPMDLQGEIARVAAAQTDFIMAHRERLVAAFVAETGLLPSECELVERLERSPEGVRVTVAYCRRRAS